MGITRRISIVALVVSVTGCATILGGGSSQTLGISSDPAGARFTIKSSSGLQMASGAAPQTVLLPRKNEYQIEFTAPGYQPQSTVLTKGVNGWIWGNLVVGWVIGFAVDFMSGSAYKLEPAQVQITMVRAADADGVLQLFGVVRQLDAQGSLVSEQKVLMVPVQ